MHAPLRPSFQAEWCGLAALEPIAAEWRALAARAIEPNVFYEPAFALAAAPVFGAGRRRRAGADGRRQARRPVSRADRRAGAAGSIRCWSAGPIRSRPLGTPLVDRDEPEAVIAAWLDHLSRDPAHAGAAPAAAHSRAGRVRQGARCGAGARSGRRSAAFGRHERALLAPGAQREGYLERAISAGKRKKLRRQRRRLEDIAPVTFATAPDAAGIEAALKDFLVLEASGWKGLAGTAIVNDPAIQAFRAERRHGARRRRPGADRPAAPQRHRHRRHRDAVRAATPPGAGRSPTTRRSPAPRPACSWSAISPKACSRSRSRCASIPAPAAGHPMIDHVWRERLALSDRLIALRPSAMPFALACRIETLAPLGHRRGQGRARSHSRPLNRHPSCRHRATRRINADQSASGKTMASRQENRLPSPKKPPRSSRAPQRQPRRQKQRPRPRPQMQRQPRPRMRRQPRRRMPLPPRPRAARPEPPRPRTTAGARARSR